MAAKRKHPFGGGIYIIRNTVNWNIYVGSAVSFRTRRNGHFGALRRGVHKNPHLQAAWNKYGEGAFEFKALHHVADRSRLASMEQHYMDLMRPAYNCRVLVGDRDTNPTAGEKLRGKKRDPLISARGRATYYANRSSAIVQFSLNGVEVARFQNAMLAEEAGFDRIAINKCLSSKSPRQHMGALWANAERVDQGYVPVAPTGLSAEGRKRLSSARLGYRHSAETKSKIAASHVGLRPTDEARSMMSRAQRRRAQENPEHLKRMLDVRRAKSVNK